MLLSSPAIVALEGPFQSRTRSACISDLVRSRTGTAVPPPVKFQSRTRSACAASGLRVTIFRPSAYAPAVTNIEATAPANISFETVFMSYSPVTLCCGITSDRANDQLHWQCPIREMHHGAGRDALIAKGCRLLVRYCLRLSSG